MERYLITGGYNQQNDGGISCFSYDREKQRLELRAVDRECQNPSYLVFSKKNAVIYAANELDDKVRITAHRFDQETGNLSVFSVAETTGAGLCHIALNQKETVIYGANYSSGSIVAFRILPDGSLGEELTNLFHSGKSSHIRQETSHVHQVVLEPGEGRLIAVDFGTDALYAYPLDQEGRLVEEGCVISKVRAGEGPRHMVWDSAGNKAYLITELGCKVFACDYDSNSGRFETRGEAELVAKEELTDDISGAELDYDPDRGLLYASVRGTNHIMILKAHEQSMTLVKAITSYGKMPRMFSLDRKEGLLVIANQGTNDVSLVRGETEEPVLLCTARVEQVSFAAFLIK